MCVIIHKPKSVTNFNEEDIRTAFENNPDGFGYCYYDHKSKRLVAKKSISWKADDIVKIFKDTANYEAIYHFRFKTHGLIVDSQAHPFRVCSRKKHGADMYMMHNGVISTTKVSPDKDESDTQAFVRKFLSPLVSAKPSIVKLEAFNKIIEDFIGSGSKLCFMLEGGEVIKVNEKLGAQRNGCWVSNSYSFTKSHRCTTYTKSNNKTKSYYDNDSDDFCWGSYGSKTATSTNNVDKDKHVFLGVEVEKGDKIFLFKKDNSFSTVGEIISLYTDTILVSYKESETSTVSINKTLDKTTGRSPHYIYNKDEILFGIPTNVSNSNCNRLANIEKKFTNKLGDMLNNLPSEESTQQITQDSSVKENTDTEDSNASVWTLADGTDVDTTNRWYDITAVVPSLVDYTHSLIDDPEEGDICTIEDFVKAPVSARLDFFLENTEAAFNMLQDLSETWVSFFSKPDEKKTVTIN